MQFNIFSLIGAGFGLFTLLVWIQFTFSPDRHMKEIFGDEIGTASARNEIRTMVGGTTLGLGILLFIGVFVPQFQAITFTTVGVIALTQGITRSIFLILKDKPHNVLNRYDAVLEVGAGALGIFLGIQISLLP